MIKHDKKEDSGKYDSKTNYCFKKVKKEKKRNAQKRNNEKCGHVTLCVQ